MSRYLHLNPVRVGPLGLSKTHRQQQRQGANQKPDIELVEQRIESARKLWEMSWNSGQRGGWRGGVLGWKL